MKLMQRFLGLLMVLAMLFSLSAEAFAEVALLRLSDKGIEVVEDGSDPSEGDVPASGNESAQPKEGIDIVETEETPGDEIPIIDPELVAKEYGESRTLKATDDKTYSVQVDIGEKAGIPKGIELAVREILPGEAGYDAYVRQSAEALKEKLDNLALVRVFDISLRDPISGNEYQPNDKVKVSIRLLDAKLNATEKLDVVHFGDEVETMSCALEGESVSFDTAGFSIYVVIGHEGDDTVVTPRVEFHFIDEEYHTNADDGYGDLEDGEYSAAPFSFVNKGGTMQKTQILTAGEALEMIANPPNRTIPDPDAPGEMKDQYFFGWYVVEGELNSGKTQIIYTWTVDPEKISFEKTMTLKTADGGSLEGVELKVGDEISWEIDGVKGKAKLDAEGTAHVCLAPVYEDYYFISYRLGPTDSGLSTIIYRRELAVLGSDEKVTVRIGKVMCPSPDAKHQVFAGWQLNNQQPYYTVDAEGKELNHPDTGTGYYVTFAKSQFVNHSLDLFPVFAEARWLYFNTGKSGNGATYVPAAYRLTNDDGNGTFFDSSFFSTPANTSRRNGYELQGWYIDAKLDEDGDIENKSSSSASSITIRVIDKDVTTTSTVSGLTLTRGGTTVTPSAVTAKDGVIEITLDSFATKLINADGTLAVTDGYSQSVSYTLGSKTKNVKLLEVENGKLYFYKALDDLTVYADWKEVEDTVVKVNVWRQKVSDDKNAADAEKTYDYVSEYSYEITAKSSWTLAQLRSNNKLRLNGTGTNVESLSQQGFHYRTTTMSTARVSSEGSTVVNVYYDRNPHTLTFQVGSSKAYSMTATTSTDASPQQYGYVGTSYLPLTRVQGDDLHSYTYTPTYIASDEQEETMYGVVNGGYVALTSTPVYGYSFSYKRFDETTSNSGTQYALVDGEYVQLSYDVVSSTTTWNVVYTYTQTTNNNGNQYGIYNNEFVTLYYGRNAWWRTRTGRYPSYTYSDQYTGTRYTRSDGGSYSGTRYTTPTGNIEYTGNTGTAYGRNGTTIYQLSASTTDNYGWLLSGEVYTGTRYTLTNTDVPYTGQRYTKSGTTYTATDAETTGLYGVDERGGHVALNRESTITSRTYTYNGEAFSGTRYIRSDTESTHTGKRYTDAACTTEATDHGDHLYGKDANGVVRELTHSSRPTYTWTYVDETTGETKTYTGTRYVITSTTGTQTWGTIYQIEALYGQNISAHFPIHGWNDTDYVNGERWKPQNSSTLSDVIVFLEIMPDENITFRLNTANYTTKTMNYYVEAIPGQTADKTYNGKSFIHYNTIYANLNYLVASLDWVDLTGFTKYVSDPAFPANGQFGINITKVDFYYTRNTYKIEFVTQYPNLIDLWDEGGTPSDDVKKVEGIPFESDLSKYGSGGTEYWVPNVPPHYTFQGWFEDAACTVPFNFNSKMADGDKILYAGWKPQKFRVQIDPNGAQIDHINHDYDNNSSDPSKRGYSGYWWDENGNAVSYSASAWNSSWTPFATFNREEIRDSTNAVERPADSGYRSDQSTYFNATYNELVGEYTTVREYVPVSDVIAEELEANGVQIYYYVNTQSRASDGSSLPSDLRNALYMTESEIDEYYDFYYDWVNGNLQGGYISGTTVYGRSAWKQIYVSAQKYRKAYPGETYKFLGWYEVEYDDEGNITSVANMPYNFANPVEGELSLRAYWRLDAGYSVNYIPEYTIPSSGAIINGDLVQWTDPKAGGNDAKYSDGASTQILQQPTGLTENGAPTEEYIFMKTTNSQNQIVYTPLEDGVYYDPGEPFTINAAYADRSAVIYMQAVYEEKSSAYRRPFVTNLRLDANGGYTTTGSYVDQSTGDTVEGTELPTADPNPTPYWLEFGNVAIDPDADQILFGNIQSSREVHLYRYATKLTEAAGRPLDPAGKNYFRHPDGYLLIGFDDDPNEGDFVPTYSADSIIGVTRNDNQTIYAVWEPMIYLNIVNATVENHGDITISLSSTDGSALSVVNEKKGIYERIPLTDLGEITVKQGETLRLAIPNGKDKQITITGTNELGTGYMLYWETDYNGTTAGHPEGHVENHGSFALTDTLLENNVDTETGLTVTFTTKKADKVLILDENWSGGSVSEIYFSDNPSDSNYVHHQQLLPVAATRLAYTFLGWDANKNLSPTVDPTYKADTEEHRTIPDPSVLFPGETLVTTLYAIWDPQLEANTVNVYKSVPLPGSQQKEFTFTVAFSGEYRGKNSTDDSNSAIPGQSWDFTIKNGEHLKIKTELIDASGGGTASWTVTVQKYDANDAPVGSATVLLWSHSTTTGIDFMKTDLSVTEKDYSGEYYVTTSSVEAELVSNTLNADGRVLSWTNPSAGGTVFFTNTRQTATINVKKVLQEVNTAMVFSFDGQYTVTEKLTDAANGPVETTTKDLSTLSVSSTLASGKAFLEEVPVGALLTITEQPDNDFIVSASANNAVDSNTGDGDNVFSFTVTGDETVTYTNTLKSYPVTFYKLDQDGHAGVEAFFRLSTSTGNIGNELYPDSVTGQFYTTDKLHVGDYTLTEYWVQENFLGLNAPVSIQVSPEDGGKLIVTPGVGDEAKVKVEGNATAGFRVYIYNLKTVKIKIAKQLDDPILGNTRSFYFNVSYQYSLNGESKTVNLSGDTALQITSGSNKTITVPVNATGLTIAEDTSRISSGVQTIADAYTTTYQLKNGSTVKVATTTGSSYTYLTPILAANDGDTLSFTNTRKKVDITIKKTVIADAVADPDAFNEDFEFAVTVLNGALPVKNYTVYDNGTPNDTTDDWKTNDSGKVVVPGGKFLLKDSQSRTIQIPVGADVTVQEVLTSAQADKYSVFICMPGGSENLLSGTSEAFKLTGPTEASDIRVYNIPSICKVTDEDGNLLYVLQEGAGTPNDASDDIYIPAIFPTIKGAFMGRDGGIGGLGNYYPKGSTTKYPATNKHQIQMLVDYEVPNSDFVTVAAGYNLLFTTADRIATDGYPFRSARPYTGAPEGAAGTDDYRAVLTRVAGSTQAFFTVGSANATADTKFTMTNLIIDGHGATLDNGVRGGCLTAYNSTVEIDNCIIYRFNAKEGGAVYTSGESLTVNDTIFDNCNSSLGGDGYGGGAINTIAQTVTITGTRDPVTGESSTQFKNCSAVHQGGAICYVGVDSAGNVISDANITVTDSDFIDCSSRAGGGMEADVKTVNLSGCKFVRCVATGTNGGAINNYYNTNKDPGGTSMTVTDCSFEGCTAENGNGGGLRSKAATTTLTDCTFTDSGTTVCSAKNGGGAAFDRGNSATIVINGGTFTNCKASESGGGIYSTGKLTIHDGTDATVITACSAKNGGGIHTSANTTLEGGTSINGCYATTSGGAIYNGSGTLTVRGNTVIDGDQSLPAAASAKNAASGGAIYCNSTLAVTGNTIIRDCVATSGGAIYVNSGKTASLAGTAQIIGHDSLDTGLETETANATEGGAIYVNNATLNMTEGTPKIQSCVAGLGGAIFAKGSETNITVSVGEISGNKATSYGGGAMRLDEGANVTVSGSAKISANTAIGTAERYGGAISIKNGNLTISGGEISGNSVTSDKAAHGGAIYLTAGSVTMTGGTISGNSANAAIANNDALGGAVYVNSGATMTLSGGTISDNTVTAATATRANGAGIYLAEGAEGAEGATLNISGSPNFGGNGIANAETGELNNSSGNLLDKAPGGTNGGQVYTKERQDIYLAGYEGEDAPSIKVTGEIDSGLGTIWVWAEKSPHYIKDEQFAVITGTSVSADSLAAFRDAQIDTKTTSTSPLYGVRDPQNATRVIWGLVGGAELSFQKVDSFGQPLAGASFSLYTDAACTAANIVTVTLEDNGANTAFTSNAQGKASCIVPTGLYYMKENDWAAGAGYENNTAVYVVLVGTYLTVPDTRTDVWNEVLSLINQDDIDAQRGKDDQNQFIRDCAVFLYDATNQKALPADLQIDAEGKVTSVPDIAARGILNVAQTTRPVILSKINSSLQPLSGGQFTILRYDLTVVATGLTSDESGVYFVGQLPYGTYYVLETKQPDGYQLPTHYFVFTISADGVKNEGAKSTNTLRASTNDDYRVNP